MRQILNNSLRRSRRGQKRRKKKRKKLGQDTEARKGLERYGTPGSSEHAGGLGTKAEQGRQDG